MGALQEVYVVDRREGERDDKRRDSGRHMPKYFNNKLYVNGAVTALGMWTPQT